MSAVDFSVMLALVYLPATVTLLNLDISYNQFYTTTPNFNLDLEYLPNLRSFHAQNNKLNGTLQVGVNNRQLESIDLSGNNFTGDLAFAFSQLPVLTELKVTGNPVQHISGGKGGIPDFMYADYTQVTLYLEYNFSCPQIKIVGNNAIVFADPSYHNWELCKCFSGFRRVDTPKKSLPSPFFCDSCIPGMICPGQTSDTEFIIAGKYWPTPNFSDPRFLLPCSTCNPKGDLNFVCEDHYEGRMCSQCVEGYYKSNSRCHKCEPFGRFSIAVSLIVLIFLLVIVTKGNTLKMIFMKEYALQTNNSFSSSQGDEKEEQSKKRDHSQAAISILINYHQTISALSEYFSLPLSVSALVAAMRVTSFVTGSGLGFQCLNNDLGQYKNYYLAIMLEPAFVIVIAAVLYTIGKPFQMCKLELFQDWGVFCTKIGLYALNILYFPIVSNASSAFRCERDPGTGVEYNTAYPFARCDEVPLGGRIAALLIYGGGILGLFFILVVKYMRNPDPNGKIFKCANFFFDTFQDKYTFFSILILFRRLSISLIVSLLPVNSALSFGLNTLVLTVSHLVIVYTKPYKSKTDNDMEIVLGSLLLFAYGIVLVVSQQNLQYGAIPMEVLYFITNLGVVLWCLYELSRRFFSMPFVSKYHTKVKELWGRCVQCCGTNRTQKRTSIELEL